MEILLKGKTETSKVQQSLLKKEERFENQAEFQTRKGSELPPSYLQAHTQHMQARLTTREKGLT